jgi:hypothetical protein
VKSTEHQSRIKLAGYPIHFKRSMPAHDRIDRKQPKRGFPVPSAGGDHKEMLAQLLLGKNGNSDEYQVAVDRNMENEIDWRCP